MKLTSILALASLFLTAELAPAQKLFARKITGGIHSPNHLTCPPGESGRLFVCSQRFGIRIIENGVLLPDYFLDLQDEINGQPQGLMSMAFHPDYANNGKFYVVYMDDALMNHFVEYQVSATDPNRADESTATYILPPTQQPAGIHNFDLLSFGPDGMLYLSTGDGGGFFDEYQNAQNMGTIFGKLLRFNVDIPAPHIPADNPFVGIPGVREEIYAYGLRQPWRYTWDSLTGNFFIGDVGEGNREEISWRAPGTLAGGNFGWPCKEAFNCTPQGGCGCADPSFIDPIYEYLHVDGKCAIIGGHVYRGSALPSLQGAYFFADYCTASLWSLRYDGTIITDFTDYTQTVFTSDGSDIGLITSFGVDADGELYIMDSSQSSVFKIEEEACDTLNYCATSPNSAGSGALLSASGTTSLVAQDLTLSVSGGPPNEYGIFYYGPEKIQIPVGDGFRCVGGPIHRLKPAALVDGTGNVSRLLDYSVPPMDAGAGQVAAGSSWHFQFWFRDQSPSGFNFSDGLSVQFCP